ncbi:MAG: response regulator [Syntrophobacteraceae bacterium]
MLKVLVVDDDDGLLFVMGEYLESHGFQFGLANNASRARDLLANETYDVIFSDLEMPGGSGFDLLRFVSGRYPEIVFIMMSGCVDSGIKGKALRMGAHKFLEKPFRFSDLIQILTSNTLAGRLPPPPIATIRNEGPSLPA